MSDPVCEAATKLLAQHAEFPVSCTEHNTLNTAHWSAHATSYTVTVFVDRNGSFSLCDIITTIHSDYPGFLHGLETCWPWPAGTARRRGVVWTMRKVGAAVTLRDVMLAIVRRSVLMRPLEEV